MLAGGQAAATVNSPLAVSAIFVSGPRPGRWGTLGPRQESIGVRLSLRCPRAFAQARALPLPRSAGLRRQPYLAADATKLVQSQRWMVVPGSHPGQAAYGRSEPGGRQETDDRTHRRSPAIRHPPE